MPYTVGVSSGWWKIERPPDLLGLATKVGSFGGTAGVDFIQADVETTSEFFEPRLKEQLTRIKEKLGMKVGLHAEVGELMSLESAERRLWEQSHLRLIETVKYAADLGIVYINVHFSARPQLYYMEREYRIMGYMYPVVDFHGRPLYHICDESKDAKAIAEKNLLGVQSIVHMDVRDIFEDELEKKYEQLAERIRKERTEELRKTEEYQAASIDGRRVMEATLWNEIRDYVSDLMRKERPEKLYQVWKKAPNARYHIDTAEIAAYKIVGAYMRENGDLFWNSLCNGIDPETAYTDTKIHADMNAAVALKYLEGHLTVKDHYLNKKYLNGMSMLEWLEKNKIILAFEIPEAHEGYEGLLRLFDPLQGYLLIRKLRSPILKLCIDFEHMLSHKLRVEDMIKGLPQGAGKDIVALHLSKPVPYFGSAHAPIPIGSRAQEIIYQWMYALRKKGFKDGYIIYERGGGKTAWDVMQNVVWTMRQMVKYLEEDVPFDDLPPEFYGVSEQTKETFARQLISVRDHAWDPLEGVLEIPEEKHTFLSKAAVDKGKKEEWEKRKFR
jgi:sugar phosphate isomerase/epimerase